MIELADHFQGIKCEGNGCKYLNQRGAHAEADSSGDVHLHESCRAAYERRGLKSCPSCKTSFEIQEPSPLGEKAASRETDHYKAGPTKRRRGVKAQQTAEDEDEDELESELEEEEGMVSQDQSPSQPAQSQGDTQPTSQVTRLARSGVSGFDLRIPRFLADYLANMEDCSRLANQD